VGSEISVYAFNTKLENVTRFIVVHFLLNGVARSCAIQQTVLCCAAVVDSTLTLSSTGVTLLVMEILPGHSVADMCL
jgi:hypothetical protein